MAIEQNKLQLESYKVTLFNKSWDKGDHKGQRYGQAFYNHFRLERIVDQGQLMNLFNIKDDKEARKLISQIFKLN